jgi:hypothetical protein
VRLLSIFASIILGLAAAGAAGAKSPAHHSSMTGQKVIVLYDGSVDASTSDRFLDLISKSEDRIIGLKLWVDTKETKRFSAMMDEKQFIITTGDPLDAPRELVVNGDIERSVTGWLIDGFYLVKFGGSHAAGALSWGAIPVDEAKIRLDRGLRVVRKRF